MQPDLISRCKKLKKDVLQERRIVFAMMCSRCINLRIGNNIVAAPIDHSRTVALKHNGYQHSKTNQQLLYFIVQGSFTDFQTLKAAKFPSSKVFQTLGSLIC